MPKFSFLKKNKTPTASILHMEVRPPEYYWVLILSIGATILVIAALISTFLSWKVLSDESFFFGDDSKNTNSNSISINEQKLKAAAEIVQNRINASLQSD